MDGTAQIVIVEDDAQIRRFVRTSLETDSYRVSEAETQSRGAIEAGTRKPDLLIVDLGLPDGSGIDLIRDIRGWSNVPILVLSARVDERDKIEALDAGADDYLTKPFGTGELLARVRAMLRRSARTPESSVSVRVFGDVTVDLAARSVARGDKRLHITPVEFRLLAHLISHPGQVLTHRQLLREIWGPSHASDSHYLRIYMARLRQKLEREPARPRHFITETGVGYRFVPD
ncbi:MAG TPA: two-component system response regulator KdpE [Casimicrobiaceae bacterium]|nr:two-component system response regulator KdpE [Casimicrobiaceae bacterium]